MQYQADAVLSEENALLLRSKNASIDIDPILVTLIRRQDGSLETVTGQLVQLPSGTRAGTIWEDCDILIVKDRS